MFYRILEYTSINIKELHGMTLSEGQQPFPGWPPWISAALHTVL